MESDSESVELFESDCESVELFESDTEDFSKPLRPEGAPCHSSLDPAAAGDGQRQTQPPAGETTASHAPVTRTVGESTSEHPQTVTTDGDSSTSARTAQGPAPPMSRIGLNAHKAGMEGLDKEKINRIILEASKGSKFYENEVRKEQQVTSRVRKMLGELGKITEPQKAMALLAADVEVEALESSRDLSRIIVHVDMDAFYAAVETRDNPSLKDVPMAVGSTGMLVRELCGRVEQLYSRTNHIHYIVIIFY